MIGKRYYEIKASILKWQRCHAKNNISGGYSWDGCSLEEHCVGSCILWYMTWQVCQIHFGSGSLAPSRFKESWGLGTSFGVLVSWNIPVVVLGNSYLKKKSPVVLLRADPWPMSLAPTNGESVWLVWTNNFCKVKNCTCLHVSDMTNCRFCHDFN